MSSILVFGGTFDPIHNGHIKTAINVQIHFHFDRFIFLPCKTPLLKNHALASAQQRLEMLSIALKDYPDYQFETDTSEINRESPSFMVTTLEAMRHNVGSEVALSLLLGQDTFEQLPFWYKWKQILLLCNILVIDRPALTASSPVILQLLQEYESQDQNELLNKTCGVIYRFNAGLFDISSTEIRRRCADNTVDDADLPEGVAEYIRRHKLYGINLGRECFRNEQKN